VRGKPEQTLINKPHPCQLGAEGIVSKRLGSPYHSGPCEAWVKVKNPAAVAVQRERSESWNR
jgi:ATP-dependent DNA ligase